MNKKQATDLIKLIAHNLQAMTLYLDSDDIPSQVIKRDLLHLTNNIDKEVNRSVPNRNE